MTPSETSFDYEAAVAACARGDAAALRRLYEQESARLLGVALRIVRDRSLAEDVVHDTFINVWRGAASFDPARGQARGWIFSIARNMAINAVRASSREVQVDEATAEAIDADAAIGAWHDAADAFEWRADTGRMARCLEQLEPVRRNCVLHAYVDGLSHSEIAERIGAPLGSVKAWIRRSLLALRECMG